LEARAYLVLFLADASPLNERVGPGSFFEKTALEAGASNLGIRLARLGLLVGAEAELDVLLLVSAEGSVGGLWGVRVVEQFRNDF